MPRRNRRSRISAGRVDYMRDRAERRGRRGADRTYSMDYARSRSERGSRMGASMGRDRHYYEEPYMEYEQYREPYRDYGYDMRGDYRRGRDYRDYADDDYDEEYYEDLKQWEKKLKKDDRYGLPKEEVIRKAEEMGVKFDDYDEDEFYVVYLMQVSDYPFIANEPNTYLAMAKAWLEDKDIEIEPSEKLCKYMYEIAMAEE